MNDGWMDGGLKMDGWWIKDGWMVHEWCMNGA
jgi:hypothetical protein